MSMDTKGYELDELPVLKEWIDRNPWLSPYLVGYGKNNEEDITADDCYLLIKVDGNEYRLIVEIKEEEAYFPCKTKRITLDAASVFYWLDGKKPDSKRVSVRELQGKRDRKKPYKAGSFYNNNIDIVLKKIKGTSTIIALDNHKLASFRKYIEDNYNLIINPKEAYGLYDTWESAFFAVSLGDPAIMDSMIIGKDNFLDITTVSGKKNVCQYCGCDLSDKKRFPEIKMIKGKPVCPRCHMRKFRA